MPVIFCLPIVIVKSSTTFTSESERTVIVGLWVIFMSFGMFSKQGFIIAMYSSRLYSFASGMPFMSSVAMKTGKSTPATMASMSPFFSASSIFLKKSSISFFVFLSLVGLRATGPIFVMSISGAPMPPERGGVPGLASGLPCANAEPANTTAAMHTRTYASFGDPSLVVVGGRVGSGYPGVNL